MGTHTTLAGVASCALLVSASAPAHAQRAALPDLVVQDLTLSHDQAAPDTVVGVTVRVANVGHADAAPFRISIYHSDGLVVPARGNVTRIGAVRAHFGVAQGQTETFKVDVRLPPCEECKPGNLYAYADAWGTVPELSESNNFKATPIQIDPRFRPNLRIDNVTVSPYRGALGRTLTIGAKLENDSPYVVYGPVKLGVFCSKDFVVDARDTRITAFSESHLQPGAAVVIKKPLTLNPSCPVHGQHAQLGILADIDNAVAESDESDNGGLAPYWVLEAPDLEPGHVAISPSAGPPGTPVVVSFTAKNSGKLPASGVDVGVFLGKSPRVTTSDPRLATHALATLPPGSTTMTLGDNLVIPELPSGTYYVGVIVDEKGKTGELREYNNMKAVPFKVVRPNLTDKHFFASHSSARAGETVSLRFALRNLGTDAAGPFKVGFYYSDDPRFDVSDKKLGEKAFDKLAKGTERGEHRLEVTLPKDARPGYRYLLMITDDDGEVFETDEVDNIAMRPLLIAR